MRGGGDQVDNHEQCHCTSITAWPDLIVNIQPFRTPKYTQYNLLDYFMNGHWTTIVWYLNWRPPSSLPLSLDWERERGCKAVSGKGESNENENPIKICSLRLMVVAGVLQWGGMWQLCWAQICPDTIRGAAGGPSRDKYTPEFTCSIYRHKVNIVKPPEFNYKSYLHTRQQYSELDFWH